MPHPVVHGGLENWLQQPEYVQTLHHQKVGCLVHAASLDSKYVPTVDKLMHLGIDVSVIFTPEHGLWGAAQYMDAVSDATYPPYGIPVRSLYGHQADSLTPALAELAELDWLIIDLQDVGSRYYTYAATMIMVLEQAAKTTCRVLVADRPNPLGLLRREGGPLNTEFKNFCGYLLSLPHRHGLTIGEIAQLAIQQHPRLRLKPAGWCTVLPCAGLTRSTEPFTSPYSFTPPSPQMPSVATAYVYPGMCLLEGTNISEGRGTTTPFCQFGAPFVDPYALKQWLERLALPGCALRPVAFVPTFNKFAGETCYGLFVHITDPQSFLPLRLGLAVVFVLFQLYAQKKLFTWHQEPYEFRSDLLAIDALCGHSRFRQALEAGEQDFQKLYGLVHQPTYSGETFAKLIEPILLY